jgi:hypothetical protein
MGQGYSKEETLKRLERAVGAPESLYASDCVKWSGVVSGGKESYSELIAGALLEKVDGLKTNILSICRPDYSVPSHHDKPIRKEELFAKSLVGAELPLLGKIIDFQLPLKRVRKESGAGKSRIGKVDLISYRQGKSPAVYLIEFKNWNNSTDSLLRSVLEIHTYYCQLDKDAFDRYLAKHKYPKAGVRKALLLGKGCLAYEQAKALKETSALSKLIKALGVEIFFLDLNIQASC